jgi:UDP-glucose-4-epimerase GalE
LKSVLITGGAGYVGSQSLLHFKSLGWRVIVLDNLSTGHADLAAFADHMITADLCHTSALADYLDLERVDGILHCASKALVGESVDKPLFYYRENVGGAAALIEAVRQQQIPIVFSSSAAVYGEPESIPIAEGHKKNPINPYGYTKLVIERMLADSDSAYGISSVALRYFNAAGADGQARSGERHDPESHLIPNLIRAALFPEGPAFELYGTDYETRDGSCLRDFIHTLDVARAHAQAFDYLWAGGSSTALNIGSGHGATVKEVLAAVERATGCATASKEKPRRPGDPASLLADISAAKKVLGWTPEHSSMDEIIQTALQWHRKAWSA